MSVKDILDDKNKILGQYLGNAPIPPLPLLTFGAVLQNGNSAAVPGTTTPQNLTDCGTIGAAEIVAPFGTIQDFSSKLITDVDIQGLAIDPSSGPLKIKGATIKGSLLVGDGTNTNTLPVGANGLVLKANSNALNGFGVEWGTDASGGTVMAVNAGTNISVGGTIAQPIVNLATPLTSTLGMGSVALTDKNGASGTAGQLLSAGAGGETLWVNPPAAGVASVSAGTNIAITGTATAPVVNVSNPFFVQVVNAPNTTNLTLQSSLGGEQSDLILSATNATTGVSTQAILDADDSVGGNGGLVKVILTDSAIASTSVEGQVLPTTATQDVRWANNIQTSDFASHLVRSEVGQTKIRCETIDTANQVNSVREDITIAGAMLDTHTATQVSTNIVAQRTETTSFSLGCNQGLQFTNPASIQVSQVQNNSSLGATYQGITEDFPFGTLHKGAFAMTATTTQGETSALYENFPLALQSAGATICNSVGATVQLSSVSSSGGGHTLRMECPQTGNAQIEHITGSGAVRNLEVQSQGYIELKNPASNNNIFCGTTSLGVVLNSNSGNLGLNAQGGAVAVTALSGVSISAGTTGANQNATTILNSGIGGQVNPMLTMTNTNASGSVALEVYKNKPTASVGGDVLFNQSVYGKDGANNKQEYTRITHSVRDNTSGTEDGSIEMSCFVNGSVNTFLQLNGIENEVNCLKNLDMTGKNIVANTGDMIISTLSSTGTGNLSVQAKGFGQFGGETGFTNLYNTNGNITLNAGGAASDLEFNCLNWESSTSSGNSSQHLRIKLNGVYYKIALQND
jgi:hypothetical protein